MDNKTYKKISAKIEDIKSKKASDIKRCEDLITDYEAISKEAERFITVDADVDEYIQATERKAKADANINACKSKIQLLKSKGLITDKDFVTDLHSIRSEQQKIMDKSFDIMANLLNQLFRQYVSTEQEIQAFNNLITEEAVIAQPDATKRKVHVFQNDKYSVMVHVIGRLKNQMESHPIFGERFRKLK